MKNNTSNEYNDFKELIDESKSDLSSYIEKRVALAKLTAYEKIAKSSSYIIYGLIISVLVLIICSLLFICAGLFIGEMLHNFSAGFGILILIILIIMVIIILNQKKIRQFFVNLTLRTIKEIEADE